MPADRGRRQAVAGLVVVLFLLIASCGGSATKDGLGVREVELGEVLVDADGHTVYLFVADQQGPSACDPVCAEAWPPLSPDDVGDPEVGVDADLVGQIDRPDGSRQVTYNGWPLYRFTGDVEPGQTSGHGILNAWFAISPVGGAAGPTE